jgi:hypothetical protein
MKLKGTQPAAVDLKESRACGSLLDVMGVASGAGLHVPSLGQVAGCLSAAAARADGDSTFSALSTVLEVAAGGAFTLPSLAQVQLSVGISSSPSVLSPSGVSSFLQEGSVIHKLMSVVASGGPERPQGLSMLQQLKERRQHPKPFTGVHALLSGAQAVDLHRADGLGMLQQLSAGGTSA